MAEVSAKLVQELRQKTGAGMMDCKKALKENEGDIEKASEWLRQKGISKADKAAGKVTAEGLVETAVQQDGRVGVLLEVNCQTDFVARNDAFKALVSNLALQAVTASSVSELLSQPYIENKDLTVAEILKQQVAQLGENMQVRRLENFSLNSGTQGVVESYIHTGGRVGVLVELDCQNTAANNEEFKTLARNIAMQVAACPNVEYVNVEEIPTEIAQKEKEIEMGRDDLANKPDNIKEKIVQGRIDKRLKEMTLVDQPYIRDQSITVEELVKQASNKLGDTIEVKRFARFVLGEGIEKQEMSFADEVAAQIGAK
ncbi:elongation factor Ts [Dulcicalothrix desertica PCC 7102]|uniref:Elongation factor Ts n=1 Tax=Dulcicalothrix desertica PCC 7102 TaxID=232991 RepID=A0A3S1J813_9CYAN|nr:translation elongation factor Ts [Dulcicalothrix desertica]RUT09592.1 elongation factor Ts [Dulcicalothrix desertica PCC 7102]TWH50791.1 elongation factor Ts [Dulcicalothrix desertica PCC 7102]